jgi:hypothetical protein
VRTPPNARIVIVPAKDADAVTVAATAAEMLMATRR